MVDPAVLSGACDAVTAMFDTVTLHTDNPGTTGENVDDAVGAESVSWSVASGGVATATVTFEGITGEWTHIGLWNSSTFVASFPRQIRFDTLDDLVVAFHVEVDADAS